MVDKILCWLCWCVNCSAVNEYEGAFIVRPSFTAESYTKIIRGYFDSSPNFQIARYLPFPKGGSEDLC